MRSAFILVAVAFASSSALAQSAKSTMDFSNKSLSGLSFSTGDGSSGTKSGKTKGKKPAAAPTNAFDPYEKARKQQQEYFRQQDEKNAIEAKSAERNRGAYGSKETGINLFKEPTSAVPGSTPSGPR
jgi:hypothetical protein